MREPGGARANADALERLIALLAKLPGLGPRSARRAALALLRRREALLAPLAEVMAEVAESVHPCPRCGAVTTGVECAVCTDPERDVRLLCVVAEMGDLWALERAGAVAGRYHVLGGLLSALDGVTPESLGLPDLAARVTREGVEEVILALPQTVDGQTTAHVVAEHLAPTGVRLTAPARGVPVGGEFDYLDEGTLAAALAARQGV